MALTADLLAVPVGALLGLTLAAPPGPMNAIIAEESVARGWPAGFRAGLGAMTADACFLVLALAGVVTVVRSVPTVRGGLFAVGGLLMLYFAWGALRTTRTLAGGEGTGQGDGAGRRAGTGFGRAFVLALTNPYQLVWWLTAGVALLQPGTVRVAGYGLPSTNGALTVAGFFGGILLWISVFPAALRVAGRSGRVRTLVGYASAAALAWFGLVFCRSAVRLLLGLGVG